MHTDHHVKPKMFISVDFVLTPNPQCFCSIHTCTSCMDCCIYNGTNCNYGVLTYKPYGYPVDFLHVSVCVKDIVSDKEQYSIRVYSLY